MSSSENRQELRTVLERHHTAVPEGDIEGVPAPFVNIYFALDGSVDTHLQFSWGMYNATRLDEKRKAAFKRIAESEGLEMENEEVEWAMAADHEWSPDEAVQVIGRILDEVYGVGFEDIDRVEKVDTVEGTDREEMENQLEAVQDFLADHDDVTVFTVANQPFKGFKFEDQTLREFAELGIDTGADELYIIEDRDNTGELDQAGVCFFHNDRPHTQVLESYTRAASEAAEQTRTQETSQYPTSSLYEESEEEQARKQEIAEELLTEYDEYLSEEERFELENQLERQSVTRLMRLEHRIKEKARVNPDEEKRLARLVYQDDRFNNQFNQTDTEMLLDDLDVEFDEDRVRIDEIHTRAKSLIKINR